MRKVTVLFVLFACVCGIGRIFAEEPTAFERYPRALGVLIGGTVAGSGIQYLMPWGPGELSITGAAHYTHRGEYVSVFFSSKNPIWDRTKSYEYNLGLQLHGLLLSSDVFNWLSTRLYWLTGLNHGGFDTESAGYKPYLTAVRTGFARHAHCTTRNGTVLLLVVPFPSWPSTLLPQQ